MAIRKDRRRRSSAADVALVRMQIAAKARNQRWYDFLCNKRDELQVRLRQQGPSQSHPSHPSYAYPARSHAPEHGVVPNIPADLTPPSTRWGLPGPEAGVVPEATSEPEGTLSTNENAFLLGEDGEWSDDQEGDTAGVGEVANTSDQELPAASGAQNHS